MLTEVPLKLPFAAVYKAWMEQYNPVFTILKVNVKKKKGKVSKENEGNDRKPALQGV